MYYGASSVPAIVPVLVPIPKYRLAQISRRHLTGHNDLDLAQSLCNGLLVDLHNGHVNFAEWLCQ
jgi:hypothetical protein